jgi:hypothetical protein
MFTTVESLALTDVIITSQILVPPLYFTLAARTPVAFAAKFTVDDILYSCCTPEVFVNRPIFTVLSYVSPVVPEL